MTGGWRSDDSISFPISESARRGIQIRLSPRRRLGYVARSFACRRMRFILFLVLFAALPAAAQDATLRGFVRDADDGSVLQGVNVRLEPEAGGTPIGSATDRDGYFIITRIAPGAYTLRITYVGYEEFVERVDFDSGAYVTREFEIAFATDELGDVVVEADGEGVQGMGAAGLTTVRTADLERIPSPGLSADLVGYLQIDAGRRVHGRPGRTALRSRWHAVAKPRPD